MNIKREYYFFLLVVLVNLAPILFLKYYPSLDGPAHLYNSNLINHLLIGNDFLKEFFVFNKDIVPNWTGHVVLCFFNLFLPAFIAEKIFLLSYALGFIFSIRNIINHFTPENKWLSYLVFPLLHSNFLFHGFYNFLGGIVLILICLLLWLKYEKGGWTLKRRIAFYFATLSLYFAHIFMFQLFLALMALTITMNGVHEAILEKGGFKKFIYVVFKKLYLLLPAIIIPIGLGIYFILFRYNPEGAVVFVPHEELNTWIKIIRPIIGMAIEKEEAYTTKIFYCLFALSCIAVYTRINSVPFTGHTLSKKIISFLNGFINAKDIFILFALVLLYLYYILPDWQGVAGYMSLRLGLLFFIFWSLWLAVQAFPKWLSIACAVIILFFSFQRLFYLSKGSWHLNELAIECESISKSIEPNSIVLPLNYSDNWLHVHFSNYLAVDKPIVVLENYEASVDFFPLQWNTGQIPPLQVGNMDLANLPCSNWTWSHAVNKASKNVDYIFLLREELAPSDSCTQQLQREIKNHYSLLASTKTCKLYKLNN